MVHTRRSRASKNRNEESSASAVEAASKEKAEPASTNKRKVAESAATDSESSSATAASDPASTMAKSAKVLSVAAVAVPKSAKGVSDAVKAVPSSGRRATRSFKVVAAAQASAEVDASAESLGNNESGKVQKKTSKAAKKARGGRRKTSDGPSDGSVDTRRWNNENIINRRTGKWGNEESKTLMDELRKQAAAAGLQPVDLCGGLARMKTPKNSADKNIDVKQIWHRVAASVPQRTMRSCYYHAEAKLKAAQGKSGTWSAEEKAQLQRLVETHGQKWTKIGAILGRYSVSCKDAYRRLSLKKKTKIGSWTDAENERLRELVLKYHADEDAFDGQTYPTKNIFWRKIAESMQGRNEYQCCNSWYQRLHGKVTNTAIWSPEADLQLLHEIQDLKVKDESEIPWASLPYKSTAAVLRRRFRNAMKLSAKKKPKVTEVQSFENLLQASVARLEHEVAKQKANQQEKAQGKKASRKRKQPGDSELNKSTVPAQAVVSANPAVSTVTAHAVAAAAAKKKNASNRK